MEAIEKIEVPDTVNSIGIADLPNLTYLSIPNSVSSIDNGKFVKLPKLVSIKLPDTLENIENGCFCNTGIQSFELPSNIKMIPRNSFSDNKSLTEVVLPDGLKGIGENAFSGNTALTKIVIPKSVEKIAVHAFSGCTSLKEITFEGGPQIMPGAFDGCPGYMAQKFELPTMEK